MKFLKATKVTMDCDLKGNYLSWNLGLSFYLCLAFDAEELMHIAEEKNLQMLCMLPLSSWATWLYKILWVL